MHHMKKLMAGLIFLFSTQSYAAGFEILVIQREATEYSQRFISGFSSKSNEKITVLKYTENKGKQLSKDIQKISPDLVLSIGDIPIYTAISELPSIPFIVTNFYSLDFENRSNVILVEDRLPIFEELSMLKLLFPNMKTVGTMYNPDYASKSFAELDQAAKRLNLKVAPIKVGSENDIGTYVSSFKGKIDAFYFISDNTTTNPKAVDALYAYMKESKIPVLSTQYSHTSHGAILSISSDPIDLGARAWERAYQTINDGKISNRKIHLSPEELNLSISMGNLKPYGIDVKVFNALLEQATEKGFTITIKK
jgi:ABC-type uncharacterized transport system substrate-binding protein